METHFYWQLHKLAFLFEKQADAVLHEHTDIGFAQYKVLEAIHQKSLAKQNVVAQMLNQTEASISRQVRILEKKGLININNIMGNVRARELSLSIVGEDVVRQASAALHELQTSMFSMLSVEEQKAFQDLFTRVVDHIDQN